MADFGPPGPSKVRVDLLLFDDDRAQTVFVEKELDVEAGGKVAELRFEGGRIL